MKRILLEKNRLIFPTVDKIIWIYNKWYKDYHDILNQSGLDIEFSSNFDYEKIVEKIHADNTSSYLLCLDDILQFEESLDLIFTRYVVF